MNKNQTLLENNMVIVAMAVQDTNWSYFSALWLHEKGLLPTL